MARVTQTWLAGGDPVTAPERGRRLGLPEDGPGSVASLSRRLGAFALDAVAADLIAGIGVFFGVHTASQARTLLVLGVFALMEFVLVATAGSTVGMRLVGLRVVRVSTGRPIGWGWSALRTVLLLLLVPAVVMDRDNRGLHDRAADAVVVRA